MCLFGLLRAEGAASRARQRDADDFQTSCLSRPSVFRRNPLPGEGQNQPGRRLQPRQQDQRAGSEQVRAHDAGNRNRDAHCQPKAELSSGIFEGFSSIAAEPCQVLF